MLLLQGLYPNSSLNVFLKATVYYPPGRTPGQLLPCVQLPGELSSAELPHTVWKEDVSAVKALLGASALSPRRDPALVPPLYHLEHLHITQGLHPFLI